MRISAQPEAVSASTTDYVTILQNLVNKKLLFSLVPVSIPMQTALDLKANLASPPFTNTPTAPTAALGTATTQLATTAFVDAAKRLVPSTIKTTAYTLVLADAGTLVRMNVAGVNAFTIPPNSTVAFPIDTVIMVDQYGAGTTTITAGVGVTLRSRGGLLALNGQYAGAAIHKIGTDEWMVKGDLI